jgi:hypothetical protein
VVSRNFKPREVKRFILLKETEIIFKIADPSLSSISAIGMQREPEACQCGGAALHW